MRLPGTRYQEHGWEQVRKLLGQCSLQACADGLPARLAAAYASAARAGRADGAVFAGAVADPGNDDLADELADELANELADGLAAGVADANAAGPGAATELAPVKGVADCLAVAVPGGPADKRVDRVDGNLAEALADTLADALADTLADYIDRSGRCLRSSCRQGRAAADGNSYGESVLELAFGLLYELQARPADWAALAIAIGAEAARLGPFWTQAGGEAILRKKFNDMYALLRDRVDADNYMVACGRQCSANRIHAYRMLDTAYAEIARLFEAWQQHSEQVGAILGRSVSAAAAPIEVRQMKSIGQCQGAWVIAWSATRERFGGSAGPLHTRSKRFDGLKNNPARIAAMLGEIDDYEQLSANREGLWQQEAADNTAWLDALARVLEQAGDDGAGPDADADTDSATAARTGVGSATDTGARRQPHRHGEAQAPDDGAASAAAQRALAVSLPPRYLELACMAEDGASWAALAMAAASMPVRLAVYLKLMGAQDDSYPAEWLDPATGALPTMGQLAGLDGLSLPTLRKRRDAIIARLQGAAAGGAAVIAMVGSGGSGGSGGIGQPGGGGAGEFDGAGASTGFGRHPHVHGTPADSGPRHP